MQKYPVLRNQIFILLRSTLFCRILCPFVIPSEANNHLLRSGLLFLSIRPPDTVTDILFKGKDCPACQLTIPTGGAHHLPTDPCCHLFKQHPPPPICRSGTFPRLDNLGKLLFGAIDICGKVRPGCPGKYPGFQIVFVLYNSLFQFFLGKVESWNSSAVFVPGHIKHPQKLKDTHQICISILLQNLYQ